MTRPLALALALAAAAVLLAAGAARAQGGPNTDAADDSSVFINNMILGTPNRQTPVQEPNLLATAPDAEHQVRTSRFTFNLIGPAYYNSNAESASTGGTATLEGSPSVRIVGSGQLFGSPLRLSVGLGAETDRYVASNGADFDKLRPTAQLQYVDPTDDQAWSPFIGFIPRLDFTPTFDRNFATRYDLNLGVNKAFNFDAGFHRLPASPTSAGQAEWALGLTIIAQRRFRSPSPASYAILLLPSATHVISPEWNVSLGIDITRRWFQQVNGATRRNLTLEPVGVLEYVPPARWFGTPERVRWFGAPALDLIVGYERNWSNLSGGTFSQVVAGAAIKAGWRF